MAKENAGWGAPKIHGELLKLGLVVSERTVARYLRRMRRRGDPAKSWLAFLENHREVIVAFDFFTVPSVTFQLLYGFFVIEHGRRKVLHCNVTRYPTADWVVQQLREAFPEAVPYRYAIFDHDSKYDTEVITLLKATGLQPKQTSVQAPWQNGVAERWVGTCRREILDHVIPLNEPHLRRLLRDFVTYYHQDRIHDSLKRTRRMGGWSSRSQPWVQPSIPCRDWADCTIATVGVRRRNRHFELDGPCVRWRVADVVRLLLLPAPRMPIATSTRTDFRRSASCELLVRYAETVACTASHR